MVGRGRSPQETGTTWERLEPGKVFMSQVFRTAVSLLRGPRRVARSEARTPQLRDSVPPLGRSPHSPPAEEPWAGLPSRKAPPPWAPAPALDPLGVQVSKPLALGMKNALAGLSAEDPMDMWGADDDQVVAVGTRGVVLRYAPGGGQLPWGVARRTRRCRGGSGQWARDRSETRCNVKVVVSGRRRWQGRRWWMGHWPEAGKARWRVQEWTLESGMGAPADRPAPGESGPLQRGAQASGWETPFSRSYERAGPSWLEYRGLVGAGGARCRSHMRRWMSHPGRGSAPSGEKRKPTPKTGPSVGIFHPESSFSKSWVRSVCSPNPKSVYSGSNWRGSARDSNKGEEGCCTGSKHRVLPAEEEPGFNTLSQYRIEGRCLSFHVLYAPSIHLGVPPGNWTR
jgi:hypothetical protein